MGNFDIPTIHTNYDLKEELNLNSCEYAVPDEANTELLSSSPTDLNVLQFNIRGLLNKQDWLTTLLHEHKVDIALLCETWFNNKTEKLIRLPNYKIYNTNWVDKIGGGVCVLSSNKLRSRIWPDLNVKTTLLEHCVVELKTDTRNILLVSGYRPPHCNVRTFLKEYSNLITSLKRNRNHEIDHNLDLLKANSHPQTNEFLEFNLRKSLIPCISKPIRITHKKASLIDNIMASSTVHCIHTPHILVDDISDHMLKIKQDMWKTLNLLQVVPQMSMSGLNQSDLNGLLPVFLHCQYLKWTPMTEKLKWNLMYRWKHLVKLLPTQAHHLQRKVPSVLQVTHYKKKTTPRKYRCKICGDVLDSMHELTTHHQTIHNILYCSICNRAFNNLLSLSRHEYKHKHKDLQCPKCDHTFTFESKVKAHVFTSNQP